MANDFEDLEQRLLTSPAARARFLADTIELFEKNGLDVNDSSFQQQMQPALDLTDGARFLSGLAASSVVIVAATAGQRGAAGQQESYKGAMPTVLTVVSGGQVGAAAGGALGKVASSVVIVAATAGQRGVDMGSSLGKAASSVVIVAATAGQRGVDLGSSLGKAASSVVIVAASAGQRGVDLGSSLGKAASSVVIVAASAGQRGATQGLESLPSDQGAQTITISIPTAITIAEVALGLRALADILVNESAALDQQIKDVTGSGGG